ncbi:MAG: hypothetical protein ACD_22C00115G0002 [uncultured bacterium]|uniref:DUF4825 domain-containing protein n=1 Tax=candidate division WWE3 bacterium TaxID=2053526 RepID=A0A656PQ06_UNCKA|nr:hypothetical protein P147_WWE3C00001G0892 [candidate division WWE3 bacterium RAAC2_WWE3_1]EKD99991.1 MAG: hypothetical protein ACD_22C00115G0002 [uncultured bacterium]KKS29495.1 MAG: hypothetical protein UU91_C0005G0027 [candidate division WWE3 bacterium GW2011_GWB1_42_117]KKS54899.1 MAG: hypothetical protein UV21_C0004G0064 [candidate division WWE3 bacterium GW2011_GWD2_42_34]KKT05515.1 MAG: hypothetical protein UV83_C0003G0070 [candidate division WWE3 bacterium GW2011_GWE2_43_18]KKT06732.
MGKIIVISSALLLLAAAFFYFSKPNDDNFKAPGRDWESAKKVEDYFVERLNMPTEEAASIRKKPGVDGTVDLRINTNVTLDGLVGNLYYYGFIRDEKAFRYALEHTKDTTPNDKAIKVGNNGTIDQNAEYRISEDMTAWDLADVLLNKPTGHFPYDEYNYFFMP